MTAPKRVICINWGTKYGAPYINRLYGMVARNITPPFEFVCFTDSSANVRPEVRCEPLPPLGIEPNRLPVGSPGIWQKSRLWGPKLADLEGPVLFLDLDLVITGNLDCFFEYGSPDDVILSRNQLFSFGRFGHFERMGQTSVFRFPVGKLQPLQQAFLRDPQGTADRYRFEQRFVTSSAPGGAKFFPKRWVSHFRQNCTRTFPLNFFLAPRLPSEARIVIFPGGVHPTHIMEGRWGAKATRKSPLKHFFEAFSPGFKGKRFSHLRHYLQAPEWVGRYWKE